MDLDKEPIPLGCAGYDVSSKH